MDIHGNIDFFESLDKLIKSNNGQEAIKFIQAAKDYTLQGFDQEQVAELLQVDGCNVEVSKELAITAATGLPIKYLENEKPETYFDVKTNIENTILSGDIDAIKGYLENYTGITYAKLIPRIVVARDNNTRVYIDEIHKELTPLIEGKIIDNNIMASKEIKTSSLLSEKEKLEFDLFGIWPIYIIQKQARKMKVEESLIDIIDM